MTGLLGPIEAQALGETAALALARLGGIITRELLPKSGGLPTSEDITIATNELATAFAALDILALLKSQETADTLRRYFQSPEFTILIEHAITLATFSKTAEFERQTIDEFVTGVSLYGLMQPEDLGLLKALPTALLHAADRLVPATVRTKISDSTEGRAATIRAAGDAYLRAIDAHMQCLAKSTVTSLEDLKSFADRYRTVARGASQFIVPPNFDERRRVPIDEIYVAPTLRPRLDERTPAPPYTITDFIASIHRTVLLGDPGGGKSTLSIKITWDLTAGARTVSPVCTLPLLPLLIVLREYGDFRKERGGTLVEFIEHMISTRYQIQPPKGALEWLLSSGRCLIILDGLDELLDTSFRHDVTMSVEAFATLYPSAPMLITSRRVGYAQAPSDQDRFDVFDLSDFADDQVAEYARKWFSLDTSIDPSQQTRLVETFVNESEIVKDLRANPLMLALMCTIYRGESYIPKNRPDVYEKCALMLFERWDRSRGLRPILSFEAHLSPAMKDLAYWIYSDEQLQSGVTQTQLVRRATDFLNTWRFKDENAAEQAAIEFVEFCRGRAWVFTDTGTTRSGERLYQFTHRTFLEYFTASHLARRSKSTAELLSVLTPRIRRAEWDVVAQLAIQIYGRQQQGAMEAILDRLIALTRGNGAAQSRLNILSFAVRCLNFAIPAPETAEAVVARCIEVAANELPRRPIDSPEDMSRANRMIDALLHPLGSVADENEEVLTDVLVKYVREDAGGENGYDSLGLIHVTEEYPFRISTGSTKRRSAEHMRRTRLELDDVIESARRTELWVAIWGVWDDQVSAEFLWEHFGTHGFYSSPWIPFLCTSYIPIAVMAARAMIDRTGSEFERLTTDGQVVHPIQKVVPVLGRYLVEGRVICAEQQSEFVSPNILVSPHRRPAKQDPGRLRVEPAEEVGLGMAILMSCVESLPPVNERELLAEILREGIGLLEPLRGLLELRLEMSDSVLRGNLDRIPGIEEFDPTGRLRGWALGGRFAQTGLRGD